MLKIDLEETTCEKVALFPHFKQEAMHEFIEAANLSGEITDWLGEILSHTLHCFLGEHEQQVLEKLDMVGAEINRLKTHRAAMGRILSSLNESEWKTELTIYIGLTDDLIESATTSLRDLHMDESERRFSALELRRG